MHAEFYKTHEHLLLDHLIEVFNEMHQEGLLTNSMKEGNIILLYKNKTRATFETTDPSHSSMLTIRS
eukprot:5475762-Prymnesium_polylepis.1